MELEIQTMLTTIIAMCALVSVLGTIIVYFVNTKIQAEISPLKTAIESLQDGQNEIKKDIISAVDAKMDAQWKALNERTMEDFKDMLRKSFKEMK